MLAYKHKCRFKSLARNPLLSLFITSRSGWDAIIFARKVCSENEIYLKKRHISAELKHGSISRNCFTVSFCTEPCFILHKNQSVTQDLSLDLQTDTNETRPWNETFHCPRVAVISRYFLVIVGSSLLFLLSISLSSHQGIFRQDLRQLSDREIF